MPYGSLQGDPATQRITHNVGLLDPEILNQPGNVVGHCLETQRPVDIGRVSVTLQFNSDDLPFLGEGLQVRPEHGDTDDSTMQQDQRFSGPANFVVKLEPVYGGVAGFHRCRTVLGESKGRCCQNDPGEGGCDELTSQRHEYFPLPARRTRGDEGHHNPGRESCTRFWVQIRELTLPSLRSRLS